MAAVVRAVTERVKHATRERGDQSDVVLRESCGRGCSRHVK